MSRYSFFRVHPAVGPAVSFCQLLVHALQSCSHGPNKALQQRLAHWLAGSLKGKVHVAQQQHVMTNGAAAAERQTIKFQVQMYTIAEATYLVDVQVRCKTNDQRLRSES